MEARDDGGHRGTARPLPAPGGRASALRRVRDRGPARRLRGDLGRDDDDHPHFAADPDDRVLREVSFSEFFSTDTWAPLTADPSFQVLRVVVGTLSTTLWGLLFAIPVGLLSRDLPERVRHLASARWSSRSSRFWRGSQPSPSGCSPSPSSARRSRTCSRFRQDAAVRGRNRGARHRAPDRSDHRLHLRRRDARRAGAARGAYALGATKLKVATRVVVPAAISGIVASIVLAGSRAVGETMVVLLAAGKTPNLTFDPGASVQTMTAFIGTTATGDVATRTTAYDTIFAVGALLFVMTFVLNMFAIRLVRRFRRCTNNGSGSNRWRSERGSQPRALARRCSRT